MSAPRPVIDAAVVAQGLAARIEELCRQLLPLGHREGAEWREARRAQGGHGDALAVHLEGAKRGVWMHGADGRAGDALDLVAHLLFAGDKKRAFAWGRDWLGFSGLSAAAAAQRARAAQASAARERADAEKRAAGRRAAAQRLWLEAQPALAGTPAAAYLKGRGIDLAALGRQPRALRFHPNCCETWANGRCERAFPALAAAVIDTHGALIGCHRTFLAPDGAGGWGKADVKAPKKILGSLRGGLIALWKGALPNGVRGKPLSQLGAGDGAEWVDRETGLVSEEHCNNSVWIAEGIEDGLSVAIADPAQRAVAAVAAGNLARLDLPAAIRFVNVALQDDGDNPRPTAALAEAVARWQAEGRAVAVAAPPAGAKDINDVLRGRHLERA